MDISKLKPNLPRSEDLEDTSGDNFYTKLMTDALFNNPQFKGGIDALSDDEKQKFIETGKAFYNKLDFLSPDLKPQIHR